MTTFKDCFSVILSGDRGASRLAARQVSKLLHSSGNHDKYKGIDSIIEQASDEYRKISEDWRQENFVIAVSVLYFLHHKESQPDFLFSWFFHLLEHQNGNIRQAAGRMLGNELGPLTYHIRFPAEQHSRSRELSFQQADVILCNMFLGLVNLTNKHRQPSYKKYKYIESLPSGPYKSVQRMLADLEEDCGKEHVAMFEQWLL